MFNFAKKRAAGSRAGAPADRRRARAPITIGFEQLEGRDMLSSGVALTIIPTDTRPLTSMPRPYVGTFNPEASRAVMVAMTPRPKPDGTGWSRRLWPPGGRFRMG